MLANTKMVAAGQNENI